MCTIWLTQGKNGIGNFYLLFFVVIFRNLFAAIPTSFHEASLDSLVWFPSKDGNFDVHTNALHFTHHLSSTSDCRPCNEGLHESILHTLRDCHILGDFWHNLVPAQHWPDFFKSDLRR